MGVFMFTAMVIIIVALIFKAKSSDDAAKKKPQFEEDITTKLTPLETMKVIIAFAGQGGYSVERIDEAEHTLVLSDGASMTSWGSYYHINLQDVDGKTTVRIETRPKVGTQIKSATRSSNERCVNGIKAALFAAS